MGLFVALSVPADVSLQLQSHQGGLVGARWIEPGDFHLTLRFIGDASVALMREIVEVLDGVSPELNQLRLSHLDAFGGDRPRAITARADPSPGLLALQSEIESKFRRLGLNPEKRKFSPHVTLARISEASAARVAQWLEQSRFTPLSFMPTQMALYSAARSRGGGPYVVEAAFPLLPMRARGWAPA